ncbi:MAG: hypothetical protein E7016_02400 [Alphaproteobacteria bacterium]|nr:hypothetical protein [Alphaproteobacteria bacterium]
MKICLYLALFFMVIVNPLSANPVFNSGNYPIDEPLQEYFAAEDENYNKSIIYIFFNNTQDCYDCPQAVELTEQVYNEYYSDTYSMFVINYQEDNEYDFATAYNLTSPLAIVLVKIQDGQALGYQKISNPQNMLSLGQDYILYLRQQIDNYLGT